jgi:hypothetical protein
MNLRRLTQELEVSTPEEITPLEDFDVNLRQIWSTFLEHNDEQLRKESAARQPLAHKFGDRLVA